MTVSANGIYKNAQYRELGDEAFSALPWGNVGAHYLAQGLAVLIETQLKVSNDVPGAVPPHGFPAGQDAVRTYTLALCAEAIELADLLGWKPWKKGVTPPVMMRDGERKEEAEERTERILDEFADILAFVGILATYVVRATGCEVGELSAQYAIKSRVNMERIAGRVAGYGVETEARDAGEEVSEPEGSSDVRADAGSGVQQGEGGTPLQLAREEVRQGTQEAEVAQ